MTNSLLAHGRAPLTLGILFGVWAAAIAVTPSMPARIVLLAPALLLPFLRWTLATRGRWIAVFFAATLLLPPLPIHIGSSGPHPALAAAAVGLVAGLWWLPAWRFVPSSLSYGLVALFAALLASVAQAAIHSGAAIAAPSLVRVALFGISVYVFFQTLSDGPALDGSFRDTRRLYWFAVASALFACVDFYFQFPAPAGYGPQFVWLDSGIYRRAQGLFYEASLLGNFCVFFLVMIAAGLTRTWRGVPVSRKAMVTGGAIFFAALALSYSRGSVVSLAVALVVLLWLERRRIRWIRVLPTLALAAAAGALLTWKIFPTFAELSWMRLSGSAEFFFSATEGVLSGRVASWRSLIEWASAHPWQLLLGIGYKTLPAGGYLDGPVVADNMYLAMLVETGVLGLAALLWVNIAILRASRRSAASADPRTSFFGVWIHCFWAGQVVQMLFGDILTYWRVLPIYLWVLALAVRT